MIFPDNRIRWMEEKCRMAAAATTPLFYELELTYEKFNNALRCVEKTFYQLVESPGKNLQAFATSSQLRSPLEWYQPVVNTDIELVPQLLL
ncbi:hypothetical protein INT45_010014 [Circinella minor]|uniref:Uncharacterized protein n=1 Tax=Circinella minor TaxID=1195481 RepID=A0A8H7VK87_9FUNG|nr:hypothetical protein INT45_010014 [Circinella minor]